MIGTRPPQHCPSPRELDDLELLAQGVFGAPRRLEGEDGLVHLVIPAGTAEVARAAEGLEVVDPEGVPVARVEVTGTYPAGDGELGIAGLVVPLRHHEFGAFRSLYQATSEAHAAVGADALTVPVSAPLSLHDLDRIRTAAAGRHVLLLVLAGAGAPRYAGRPLSPAGLLRASLDAATLLDSSTVVAVPLAARASGDIDEDMLDLVLAAYAPGEVMRVTGEGPLPGAVADIVATEQPPPDRQGLVLFFTGLSGSGKSTLARALYDVIVERGGRTITSLDGDVVRRNLSAGLTFSKEDRETNIRRIGWVAAEISRHHGIALCSPIAPFDSTRKAVRQMVAEAGGAFFLIHVATPLEECERRDRKGLYAKARRGEIPEFTGISSPYEEPEDADVRVDTTGRSIEDALGDVLEALHRSGFLPRPLREG